MQLRPYQEELLSKARAALAQGARSVCVQAPTASGKTHIIAAMMAGIVQAGQRAWFLAHRAELVEQADATLTAVGVPHGVMARGRRPSRRLAQVVSVPWLIRHLEESGPAPAWGLWDEAHHCPARSWAKVIQALPGSTRHIGFTATPVRLDGQGLQGQFDALVGGPTIKELIGLGWLSRYRLFAPRGVSVSGLRTFAGDWAAKDLQALVDRPSITGTALQQYTRHAAGKRALVFCASRSHSRHVAQSFQDAGISARHLDGDTPAAKRAAALKDFRNGKINVLCNVDLFGEGFDLPSLDCVIMLRPTQSLRLYLQQVGRAMRPESDKEHAIILDHVGNCGRFGLPDDEREWTLEGVSVKSAEAEPGRRVRICPVCGFAQGFGTTHCAHCQAAFPLTYRPPLAWKPGELQEVDPAWFRAQQDQELQAASTLELLTILAAKRGLTAQWALRVHMARQAALAYGH